MNRRVAAIKDWCLVSLVFLIFNLLRWTWRFDEERLPADIMARLKEGLPVVFAHWHEDEWALLGFYAHRNMIVLVSHSQDGTLMTRFLEKLGFAVVRGSSSKGGATGLLNLIKSTKGLEAKAVSLAIDGPRGPRRRSKLGIFKLAEVLNAPIVSGAAGASRAWVFRKSWSKAFIPKPWARIKLCYSAPIREPAIQLGVRRDDYATLAYGLEEGLKDAKIRAFANTCGHRNKATIRPIDTKIDA